MGLMHNKAMWTALMSGSSNEAVSLAAHLLDGEANGFAIDFTDDYWVSSTGFYGSARTKDQATPANTYNTSPDTTASSLLTYTSPSLKMTRGPGVNGTLRYGAHNLYLNSASPANQAITVVSGATYAVTITGSVSVTASGAATGTWTAGTQTFTAATTTLTFGSTSGSGTVHVRRTPSDSTYLATSGAIRISLPLEWDTNGDPLGLLVEEQRTNLCLYSNDLTNAAWTKTNCTAAKTATGPDGVSNSASTLTATAGNATCLQAITSASAARITSCYIKRRTGTGDIEMTQDNGSTWAAVTVTSNWTRVNIAAATLANPTVGLRIVTSGDAVDVSLFDHEVGSFITSPIETFASSVTRAGNAIYISGSAVPTSTNQTFFAEVDKNTPSSAVERVIGIQSAITPLYCQSITAIGAFDGADAQSIVIDSLATGVRKVAFAGDAADGTLAGSGGTTTTFANIEIPQATIIHIGYEGTANQINGHIRRAMYLPRRMSESELETLTTP